MVKEEKETENLEIEETTEEKTPTAEELLAQAKAQIDALTKGRDEFKTGLSTAHSNLSKKDQELKKRAEIDARLDGFEETQKILAAMLNERVSSGEMEPSEKKDYLLQFDEITKRQKAEREQAQARSQQEEYGIQARATYAKAKEVYPDDDVKLLRIERFLDQGMLDEAEALIAKAKPTDTKEDKVESEEQKQARWIEEGKRLAKEEAGILATDNGGPSGSAEKKLTRKEVEDYSPQGKTTQQMMKDAEKILKQVTEK